MPTVNGINTNIDLSARVFNDFFDQGQQVPTDQYDAVNSFFESIFGTGDAAKAFTDNLFTISRATKTSVLDLLYDMQGLDSMRITATMCYYLNGIRSPSTLLGINTVVQPNIWAARNVMI